MRVGDEDGLPVRSLGDDPPAGVQDAVGDGKRCPFGGVHVRPDQHGGLPVGNFRGGHIYTAPGHALRSRADQSDIAVDAAAGVPAAAGLDGIVHPHGDDVVLPHGVQQRGDVQVEGTVAVGPSPGLPAVDPDGAVHIHAVEFQGHAACIRGAEMLAVPADSAREGAAVDAGGVRGGEFPFDAPVVRQVQGTPGGVIKGLGRPRRVVPELETPVEIEIAHRAGSAETAGADQQAEGGKEGKVFSHRPVLLGFH